MKDLLAKKVFEDDDEDKEIEIDDLSLQKLLQRKSISAKGYKNILNDPSKMA